MKLIRHEIFQITASADPRRNPIIHVGAHHGEEMSEYKDLNYATVLWIEAQEKAYEELKNNVGEIFSINAGLWDKSGVELDFHVTNNSVSSSFFRIDNENESFEGVSQISSIKVSTLTLYDAIKIFEERKVLNERFVLRLDVQGAEYRILKSSLDLLYRIDFICCEVTRRRLFYRDSDSRKKIVFLLLAKFWIPAYSRINPVNSHGETIFIPLRRVLRFLKPMIYMRILSAIDTSRYWFHANFFMKK